MSTETEPKMTEAPSALEGIKARSNFLRGTLREGLADPVTGAIREDDTKLLKFHGSYQQDDRDLREERRQQKLEPAYQFMVRARLPGGVCTPAQWLALDDIARRYGRGTLKLTTRQTFQIHGVLKRNLKHTMAALHATLLDSIAACGDVNRNVICAANPHVSALHRRLYETAAQLSEHLRPRTRAYHEIWLDEERVAGTPPDSEPMYGATYLPRKFKIALTVPPDNDVDVFAHDLGYIAIVEDGQLLGYNVSVGGGMGCSYGNAATYPRLGEVIGFVRPDVLNAVSETVIGIQRDFGNRSDRLRARFKYTIDAHGIDWLRGELERRLGWALEPARPFAFTSNGDRYGWVEGEDGHAHLTLHIEAGRVHGPIAAGLREIAQEHRGEFRLTTNQNLIIANVAPAERAAIDALVRRHGLDGHQRASGIRRNAIACVALPTCGLAMAESERYLPTFLERIEERLARHGLLDAPIVLRLSGCPNGCSRPYLAEIALTGKAVGRYNLNLGGDFKGQRLNRIYRENVTEAEILDALDPLFADYARERQPDERFGDFLHRTGVLTA